MVFFFYGVLSGGGWEGMVFKALTSDLKDIFRTFARQLAVLYISFYTILLVSPKEGLCTDLFI